MLIIFEGMDRCGKDTQIKNTFNYLINHLNDIRPIHVIHYSAVPIKNKNQVIEYSKKTYNAMFNIAENYMNHYNIILNRAHLGECVYGYIYRNYQADWIFDVELEYHDLVKSKDTVLITLVDSSWNCLTREDGNSLSNCDIQKANLEYDRFFIATNKSNIRNKYFLDIANKTIEEVKNDIYSYLDVIYLEKK